jgi:uncharacterized protein YdaU (DUF1376 family)
VSLSGPFLFDPRAFWGDEDVKLLSWSQIGVYLALLSHQWEEGDIPEDRRRARAAIAGGEREKVPDADLDAVFPFFGPVNGEPGRLRNERLHEEREAWKAKKAKRSAAGKASGAARRRASAEQTGATDEQMPNTCSADVEQVPNRSVSSSSSGSVSSSVSAPNVARPRDPDPGLDEPSTWALQAWEAHVRYGGTPHVVARPQDLEILERWENLGLPVELAVDVVRRCGEQFHRNRTDGDHIGSLKFYRAHIGKAVGEWKRRPEVQERERKAAMTPEQRAKEEEIMAQLRAESDRYEEDARAELAQGRAEERARRAAAERQRQEEIRELQEAADRRMDERRKAVREDTPSPDLETARRRALAAMEGSR